MSDATWVRFDGGGAACRALDGARRAAATRVLHGRLPVPAALERAAEALEPTLAFGGRVQGRGTFEDPALAAALAAALPAALAPSLRPLFEWYGCFGASFHNDAHYAGVLFGVVAVRGPARDVVFPRIGVRVPAAPGAWAVFDPFEPHGVLGPDRIRWARDDYAGTAPTLFAGFELELTPAVRAAFGIVDLADDAIVPLELASRTAINAETGALS